MRWGEGDHPLPQIRHCMEVENVNFIFLLKSINNISH